MSRDMPICLRVSSAMFVLCDVRVIRRLRVHTWFYNVAECMYGLCWGRVSTLNMYCMALWCIMLYRTLLYTVGVAVHLLWPLQRCTGTHAIL
jgi:hypothetical protein